MKKNLLSLICALACAILIFSCGKDGKTGDCYMSVSKGGNCISSYWDDNSCLPSPCNYNQNYGPCTNVSSDVQHFNYNFYFCSGSGYTGTYSIGFSLADGTKGGFLHRGTDGEDKYFTVTTGTGGLETTVRRPSDKDAPALNPASFVSAFDTTKTTIDTYVNFKNCTMHITGKKVWKKPGEVVKSKMAN
ncbi:MAG: hypothetical protein NTX97_00645 [Bacteroidetes bacterium]|nr:hypothetical protein [Bacteroidota bacterium]